MVVGKHNEADLIFNLIFAALEIINRNNRKLHTYKQVKQLETLKCLCWTKENRCFISSYHHILLVNIILIAETSAFNVHQPV